jgi:hypothetical protein
MVKTNNLIKVFIGEEASAILLKSRLEEIGISVLIKNDSPLSFYGGSPPSVDLYIQESYLEKAKPIISEYPLNNKG